MADRLRCVVKRITYQNPDNGYSVIHKSQGSEYSIVVMPVMMTHYVMLQRNLVYTGITRAKKGLVLVGSRKAMWCAVQNMKVEGRNTLLAERLKGAV